MVRLLTTDRNGDVDSAYDFDGTDDRISIPAENPLLPQGDSPRTLSFSVGKNRMDPSKHPGGGSKWGLTSGETQSGTKRISLAQ